MKNYIFLMDPLESVIFEKDTSLMFMLESARRKNRVFFLPEGAMSLKNGEIFFKVIEVVPQNNRSKPFLVKKPHTLSQKDVDCVFIRKDPPFDQQYLFDTWLLDQIKTKVFIFNDPTGIRTVNEKIWASQFKNLIPPTLISRQKDEIYNFINQYKDVIVKPTDSFGGQGVFHLHKNGPNLNVTLEAVTGLWGKEVIVQQFIREASLGDKRILLLNGEPLGAIIRLHPKTDHRNNLFAGGKALATKITTHDLNIIKTIKPYLQRLGLYFVGIDILGKYLIEVNVTSPTCLQEMNRLYAKHLEKNVLDFIEEQIKIK